MASSLFVGQAKTGKLSTGTNTGMQGGLNVQSTGSVGQGGSGAAVQNTISGLRLQPATGIPLVGSKPGTAPVVRRLGATTTPVVGDTAASQADAQAAADAAKAAELRGQVTDIANKIKEIFNSRYGQAQQSAQEQTGKLNNRFATESQDLATQVEGENQALGAAHAATGSYDSSYRSNNQDTVTHDGQKQERDLGSELHDNLASIAEWVAQQKASHDGQTGGINSVLSHLQESTDPAELTQLRNTLDARIADLTATGADNNTTAQNAQTLESVAPSAARAQQLKTTLSQIVGGNADSSQKSAIGAKLIQSAGLDPADEQALLSGFQSDISKLNAQN